MRSLLLRLAAVVAFILATGAVMLAITVALLPVVWLLGILPLIGYGIDPMSVLVPFLIFSIGVSHAVQMTNAWKQDVLEGQRHHREPRRRQRQHRGRGRGQCRP